MRLLIAFLLGLIIGGVAMLYLPKPSRDDFGAQLKQQTAALQAEIKSDCFLTVKSGNAPARLEVELPIAPDQFSGLWPLTEGRRVFKRRCRIPIAGGLTAELDVYEGGRAGLQVVEVEFSSESQARLFTPPPWFGQEVTHDTRYANAELAG